MEQLYSQEHQETNPKRKPEARYAYYVRCQVFRKGGDQCRPRRKRARTSVMRMPAVGDSGAAERERRAC